MASFSPRSGLLCSLAAALLVVLATVVQLVFLRPIGGHHPFLVFYLPITIAALCLGSAGGVTATVLSALSGSYFWMYPRGSLYIEHTDDQIYIAVFFLEGLLITYAAEMMRRSRVAEIQAKVAQEREKAAAILQESEQRLRMALEGGEIGMWTWDVGSNLSEWNDQEYDLLGLPRGDGREPTELFFGKIYPEDRPELKRILDELMEQGTVFAHEFRIVRADGEIRWIAGRGRLSRDPEGRPGRMRGVNFDITARKQAEEELRRSEREARARADELAVLMDTVPAFTFIAHDPECRRMSGSRRSRELLRVPEGMSVSATALNGERATTFRCMKDGKELVPEELPVQLAAKGQEIRDFELTIVLHDGTTCELYGDAVPLFDEEGKVRGAIGAFLDVSERKRIQQELQKARDELEKRVEERTAELRQAMESLKKESEERIQALDALRTTDQLLIHQSRLATMGEMINNIAHQWRQPLNVMSLIIQELPVAYRTGTFSEEYLATKVAKANYLVAHMSQTIEDFRNFFKPSRDKVQFKTADMIAKTLVLLGDTFKKLDIEIKVDERGGVIYGYLSECCQVLLNILINARDAFVERPKDGPRVISIEAFREGDRSIITVADNAGGIPEEIIGEIFNAYFTTKAGGSGTGTGIGLFMAKNIIEKHMNGSFTVRNVAGGAEFRIEVDSNPPQSQDQV